MYFIAAFQSLVKNGYEKQTLFDKNDCQVNWYKSLNQSDIEYLYFEGQSDSDCNFEME